MSATTKTRKPKTIVTPEFTCRGGILNVTVGEKIVELRDGEVFVQTSPAMMRRIGRITKDGTGWTAFVGDDDSMNTMPSFIGDHFPVRTGKHTQLYAVCYLVAVAAGMGSSAATYDLNYEGVRA